MDLPLVSFAGLVDVLCAISKDAGAVVTVLKPSPVTTFHETPDEVATSLAAGKNALEPLVPSKNR